jgi:hypothetical protein
MVYRGCWLTDVEVFLTMNASTRNLRAVPSIERLRRQMQALALLDAILEAEWEYRYFSFNSRWSQSEQMGSMRNGSGDDLFAIFDKNGCFLRGFDHESLMSPWASRDRKVWPGVLDEVPSEFEASLREPAFHMEDTTFCIWRRSEDSCWHCGSVVFPDGVDPDGSGSMLSLICGTAGDYASFAKDYYEVDVRIDAVERVLSHESLSKDLLSVFPTMRTLQELSADAIEIGYQIAP